MKALLPLLTGFYLCFASACRQENPPDAAHTLQVAAQDDGLARTAELRGNSDVSRIPECRTYLDLLHQVLRQPLPVIPFLGTMTEEMKTAELLCLSDYRFLQHTREPSRGGPYRSEVFNIYPARGSDLQEPLRTRCAGGNCYKVEMYNYALNLGTVALVDIAARAVLEVNHYEDMQPEIPEHLRQLAIAIAAADEGIREALGYKPGEKDAVMSATKTALNRSRCERSMHLCVAPTFIRGDKALWAIVDLTDLQMVGYRWTNVGDPGPVITQRRLENEKVTGCYCHTETPLEKDGWELQYMITSSDGLRISGVRYKERPVLHDAKLVDWHVSYSNSDGFGFSDAVGCPFFSTAAVVATESPRVTELLKNGKDAGFALEQDFYTPGWPRACQYSYRQRYEFYNDGRFRITCASLGRGCGSDGIYRPVMRIAFDPSLHEVDEWTPEWSAVDAEGWTLQGPGTRYTKEGYQFRITNGSGEGFYLEPGQGQFGDGGRGDNAYTYFTAHHPEKDEGERDMITIGPCCNPNHEQGPEKFIEPDPEPLTEEGFVLWYVPQMRNDNTPGKEYCWAQAYLHNGVIESKVFPCYAGPMFIPAQ